MTAEYRLCEAKTAKKLQRVVNGLLNAGWQPIGGASVAQSNDTAQWWYYQAMIREEDAAPMASAGLNESAKPPSDGFGDFP